MSPEPAPCGTVSLPQAGRLAQSTWPYTGHMLAAARVGFAAVLGRVQGLRHYRPVTTSLTLVRQCVHLNLHQ